MPVPVSPPRPFAGFELGTPEENKGEEEERGEMTMQVLLGRLGVDEDNKVGIGMGTVKPEGVSVGNGSGTRLAPAFRTSPNPNAENAKEGEAGEEPSIEELLAHSSDHSNSVDKGNDKGKARHRHIGAEAWELDFGAGETVKRVPLSVSQGTGIGSGSRDMRIGRSSGKGREERRGVQSLFVVQRGGERSASEVDVGADEEGKGGELQVAEW
jgi:hypothetical protein